MRDMDVGHTYKKVTLELSYTVGMYYLLGAKNVCATVESSVLCLQIYHFAPTECIPVLVQ